MTWNDKEKARNEMMSSMDMTMTNQANLFGFYTLRQNCPQMMMALTALLLEIAIFENLQACHTAAMPPTSEDETQPVRHY